MDGLKRLVLVGAGHAHALVLDDWSRRRVPEAELVVVSPSVQAPYSGMVPGWLAGTYRFDEICIDVAALASAAGARLVIDELTAVDPVRRQVRLASGASLDYDLLSLNTGSTLEPPSAAGTLLLALRPLGRLQAAWESLLKELEAGRESGPLAVTAVGGGAAGFESLLAVLARLRSLQPGRRITGRLVSSAPTLLPGMAPGAVRAAKRALDRAGVTTRLDTAWNDHLADAAGEERRLLLWAAGARAPAWQRDPGRRGGLAAGDEGFLRIDQQLRSVSHPEVFAAGDCAEWVTPLPKAGVYAVRMAPVLARNLRAALRGEAAEPYEPQRRFLALLSTADGRAIGSRGRWSAEGRWLWHWKDHIDRAFVRRFARR